MKIIKKTKKKGFTLIELIAVVAILAVLAAVAVPRVIEYVNKSKRVAVQTTATTIYNTAESAYNDGKLTGDTTTGIQKLIVKNVVAELQKEKLISQIDTEKLGDLYEGTMEGLETIINENQEKIKVNSEGTYQS